MPRVLSCLALAFYMVLGGTGVLGIRHGDGNPERHVLLGVFSLLLSCLIQIIVFTYLTVTAKMTAQSLHMMQQGLGPLMECKRIKGRVTLLLACAFASLLAVTITGAIHWRTGGFAILHWMAVLAMVTIHGWVFYEQYGLVVRNGIVLDGVLRDYSAFRQGRSEVTPPRVAAGSWERPND